MYDPHNGPEHGYERPPINPGENDSYLNWDISSALGSLVKFLFLISFLGWIFDRLGSAMGGGSSEPKPRKQRKALFQREEDLMRELSGGQYQGSDDW